MSGRTIIGIALAASICALGGLGLLYLCPGGTVASNRWMIVGSATATGLAALILLLPTRPQHSRFLLFAPSALLLASVAILLATLLVPWVMTKRLGGAIAREFPVDFDEVFRIFPERPEPQDFRALEWRLIEAECYLVRLNESLRASGLATDRQWQWIDAELRSSPLGSTPVLPSRACSVPEEKRDQYRRIAARLRQCADNLDRTVRATRLPTLIQRVEAVTRAVRTQYCDPYGQET